MSLDKAPTFSIEEILGFLVDNRTRATYGAVGEVIGSNPRGVGRFLGPKRAEASWVVSAATGLPTGYALALLAPGLDEHPEVIRSGSELSRRMQEARKAGR